MGNCSRRLFCKIVLALIAAVLLLQLYGMMNVRSHKDESYVYFDKIVEKDSENNSHLKVDPQVNLESIQTLIEGYPWPRPMERILRGRTLKRLDARQELADTVRKLNC